MSIAVRELSKFYGRQLAVNNVSFEIGKGEIVGFIGPNGAGKSTIMKIICGYLSASSGSVTVAGYDVEREAKAARRNIGYLPEHNPLYLDMYVREYLRFTAGLYSLGRQSERRVAEMIDATGLGNEQHKRIGQLSKGYRQRVGLAQALIHNPAVLILDEPTTGLDPNQIIEIRNLISEVGRSKTVLLSTHIMQEVEAICHRTLIISKGELVANTTVGDIRKTNKNENRTILVEFSSPVETADFKAIDNVSDVSRVEGNRWLVHTIKGDVRPAIFQMAVDKKIAVLEMQIHEKSLEEVFHELTK